jgi:hypothetical protein
MPALPAVPKVVQIAVQTHMANVSDTFINRLHFQYTGTAPTGDELLAFANTVLTAWGAALDPSMDASKSFVGLTAIDLSSPTSATAETTDDLAGSLAGTILPADACFVMSATVGRRYRGGHPRSYLPLGVETSLQTGRTWTAAFITAVSTAWAGLITAIEGAGWAGAGTLSAVNVSYYEGFTNLVTVGGRAYNVPKLRVGGPVIDPITGYVGRAQVGSQRRRLAA